MLNRTRKGMTLLELIVVIVILGILALIAIPTFAAIINKSKTQSAVTTAQALDKDAMGLAAFDQKAAGAVDTATSNTYVHDSVADLSGFSYGGNTTFANLPSPVVAKTVYGIGGTTEATVTHFELVGNDTSSIACYTPGAQGVSGTVTAGACTS